MQIFLTAAEFVETKTQFAKMEEDVDGRMVDEQMPPESKEGNRKCFHLFNCDKTYNLDAVENLLKAIEGKVNFDITISTKKYFRLSEMSELCETVKSGPPMDFAIFVVHAHESRLSINEDNAGIGYARFYRALLQAAGERVLVVIGGDDNYKDAAEEERAFLSRWAKRQVSSQFKEEFMDGQKSFIFSWDQKYNPIHEEALLHFLHPAKTGTKFVHEPKRQPTTPSVDTSQAAKSEESGEVSVKTQTKINYSNVQPVEDETLRQKAKTRRVEKKENGENDVAHQPPDMEKPKLNEPVNAIPEGSGEQNSAAKPESDWYKQLGAMAKDTPLEEKKVAIICRDQSDITIIKDLFGDELLTKVHIFSGRPEAGPKSLLSIQTSRSCIIVVDARTMEEELHHKSGETPYEDLLRAARESVEQKVVIIICSDRGKTSQNGEDAITSKIKHLLGDKGIILWWKETEESLVEAKKPKRAILFSRSKSLPGDGAAKGSVGHNAPLINPEEFTLLLKTRLHHGRISYQEEDVKQRLQGWTAPEYIANDLMEKRTSTAHAELLIYRENNTGNFRVVVNDEKDSKSVGKLVDSVKGGIQDVGDYLSSQLESFDALVSGNELDNFFFHTY
ncbi:uncharacterized protein LOC144663015 [Oculina patagonica]